MRIAQRKTKKSAVKEAELVPNEKLAEPVPNPSQLGLIEQPVRLPLRQASLALGMMYACADSTRVPEIAEEFGQKLVLHLLPRFWASNLDTILGSG
jgi:hypothetical protein